MCVFWYDPRIGEIHTHTRRNSIRCTFWEGDKIDEGKDDVVVVLRRESLLFRVYCLLRSVCCMCANGTREPRDYRKRIFFSHYILYSACEFSWIFFPVSQSFSLSFFLKSPVMIVLWTMRVSNGERKTKEVDDRWRDWRSGSLQYSSCAAIELRHLCDEMKDREQERERRNEKRISDIYINWIDEMNGWCMHVCVFECVSEWAIVSFCILYMCDSQSTMTKKILNTNTSVQCVCVCWIYLRFIVRMHSTFIISTFFFLLSLLLLFIMLLLLCWQFTFVCTRRCIVFLGWTTNEWNTIKSKLLHSFSHIMYDTIS